MKNKINLGREEMIAFIKDLLSLDYKGSFHYNTIHTDIEIHNKDCTSFKLQREIYNWLSVPERKENFTHNT